MYLKIYYSLSLYHLLPLPPALTPLTLEPNAKPPEGKCASILDQCIPSGIIESCTQTDASGTHRGPMGPTVAVGHAFPPESVSTARICLEGLWDDFPTSTLHFRRMYIDIGEPTVSYVPASAERRQWTALRAENKRRCSRRTVSYPNVFQACNWMVYAMVGRPVPVIMESRRSDSRSRAYMSIELPWQVYLFSFGQSTISRRGAIKVLVNSILVSVGYRYLSART